eukprot:904965-Pelagomonas_calceolata.AAC.4
MAEQLPYANLILWDVWWLQAEVGVNFQLGFLCESVRKRFAFSSNLCQCGLGRLTTLAGLYAQSSGIGNARRHVLAVVVGAFIHRTWTMAMVGACANVQAFRQCVCSKLLCRELQHHHNVVAERAVGEDDEALSNLGPGAELEVNLKLTLHPWHVDIYRQGARVSLSLYFTSQHTFCIHKQRQHPHESGVCHASSPILKRQSVSQDCGAASIMPLPIPHILWAVASVQICVCTSQVSCQPSHWTRLLFCAGVGYGDPRGFRVSRETVACKYRLGVIEHMETTLQIHWMGQQQQ